MQHCSCQPMWFMTSIHQMTHLKDMHLGKWQLRIQTAYVVPVEASAYSELLKISKRGCTGHKMLDKHGFAGILRSLSTNSLVRQYTKWDIIPCMLRCAT